MFVGPTRCMLYVIARLGRPAPNGLTIRDELHTLLRMNHRR